MGKGVISEYTVFSLLPLGKREGDGGWVKKKGRYS